MNTVSLILKKTPDRSLKEISYVQYSRLDVLRISAVEVYVLDRAGDDVSVGRVFVVEGDRRYRLESAHELLVPARVGGDP